VHFVRRWEEVGLRTLKVFLVITIVAVPVASLDRLEVIRDRCDQVICLAAPQWFEAVGQFYDTFETIEDEQVVGILQESGPHKTQARTASKGANGMPTRDF
jgi:predicted phosphoribosyltransferase